MGANSIPVLDYWWSKVIENGFKHKVCSISLSYYSKKGYINVLQWFLNKHMEPDGIDLNEISVSVFSDKPGLFYRDSVIMEAIISGCGNSNKEPVAVLDWWYNNIPTVFKERDIEIYKKQADRSATLMLQNVSTTEDRGKK
jgi:hypothetical protein